MQEAAGAGTIAQAATRYSGTLIAVVLVLLMEFAAVAQGTNAFGVLISGLTLGSLYAVVALGYTMVYGIIELINFAHGDVFAFGAFASLWLMEKMDSQMADVNYQYSLGQHSLDVLGIQFHVPGMVLAIWTVMLAMVIAAVLCAILGVAVERIAYRPLRNAPRLAPLITAIGMSFIIENLLLQWRGGSSLSYPQIVPLTHPTLFGAAFSDVDILAMVVALVMMVLLDRFVNATKLGKAMRAVAQDREAALMMGINVDRIIAVTFIVGSALAGAGAVIYGMDLGSIGYNMGFTLGLYAFTAAVLGGIGNIRGAMLGGLLIGMVQQFVNTLDNGQGTAWSDPVVFAVLVLVLVFRPSGLLGAQIPEKV
ncbi:MAG TPA: branched-chain amino acid ABC transporter permease [Chloroflexota bacterium]|nr:branched-chain amino acid ABC transporter permease [Chloroflexota bacterium]